MKNALPKDIIVKIMKLKAQRDIIIAAHINNDFKNSMVCSGMTFPHHRRFIFLPGRVRIPKLLLFCLGFFFFFLERLSLFPLV